MATLEPIDTLIELHDRCKAGDEAYQRLCIGALESIKAAPWAHKLYPAWSKWELHYRRFGEFLDTRRYTEPELVKIINNQIGKCGAVVLEWPPEPKKQNEAEDVSRFLPADEEEEVFPTTPKRPSKKVEVPVSKMIVKKPVSGEPTDCVTEAMPKPPPLRGKLLPAKKKSKRPRYDPFD